MLHSDRDLPRQTAQLGLARGEVLGLGFAPEPGEQSAGRGGAHLQIRKVASPLLALAAGIAESRVARVIGAPQCLVGAMRFRLCALELAVEMAGRRFERSDVGAQDVGVVTPLVDQQDRIRRGRREAGPRLLRGLGVGARFAQPRELRLRVNAAVVEVRERDQCIALERRFGVGDALRRWRERAISVRPEVGDQPIDAGLRLRRIRLGRRRLFRARAFALRAEREGQPWNLCGDRRCHAEQHDRGEPVRPRRARPDEHHDGDSLDATVAAISAGIGLVRPWALVFRTSRADCATGEITRAAAPRSDPSARPAAPGSSRTGRRSPPKTRTTAD